MGDYYFDESATEGHFSAVAKDYAIIHLAMHVLLNQDFPVLSSLAFSESGDSTTDNFLEAWEVAQLDLNAELVVLSAFETGYGRFEKGNGIASLARAFMYAGVPSLIVSLWQVNDQSTSTIMQNFYAHLAQGMDKATALQQAKLDYIEQVDNPLAAHPAFWAPFIQLGDSQPIKLTKRNGSNWIWWIVGAGSLLILLAGIAVVRKKRAA